MKFILEVDLTDMAGNEGAGKELGRILRYWGGAMKDIELTAGQGQDIYDSEYRQVGRWVLTD